MIDAGEQRHDRGQAWAKGGAGNDLGVVYRPRPSAAASAAHFVPPPLGHVRAIVAQIKLLVTTRGCVGDLGQRVCAAFARRGKQVDELVDPIRREQLPVRAAAPLLPTALAP